jgi:hypothetical protein
MSDSVAPLGTQTREDAYFFRKNLELDKATFESLMGTVAALKVKLDDAIHAVHAYVDSTLVVSLPAGLIVTGKSVTTLIGMPVYEHTGVVDPSEFSIWPPATFGDQGQISLNGNLLFTFKNDTANQPPTGDGLGGVWHSVSA